MRRRPSIRMRFHNECPRFSCHWTQKRLFMRVIKNAARLHEIRHPLLIELVFVQDDRIRKMNADTRGVDRVTDVLSFPMIAAKDGTVHIKDADKMDHKGRVFLGEIVIAPYTAQRQAEEYGHSIKREMAFLVCHGFLHLLGYDHLEEEREKKMVKMQKKVMRAVRVERAT